MESPVGSPSLSLWDEPCRAQPAPTRVLGGAEEGQGVWLVSVSIPESGREGCEALLQSSPWLSLHISNAKGYFWSSRHTQHHSKPLCVITDPQFLLGFHLFNLPVSSAFNTPSSVRGQKRSLYIQKDTSSLQQLLYLTKKIHGVVMATVLSKNRSAIYSTAQSTAELTEAALTAHWEMQADFCSLGGLVSSISHEITQRFAN